MGTRADFYVGRGLEAEYLGSIAWDGYPYDSHPGGVPLLVTRAKSESKYREAVTAFLAGREDATKPAQGWPWPWENSSTTDYAYAFDKGRVFACALGGPWWNVTRRARPDKRRRAALFPDMRTMKQREKLGPHSGVIEASAQAPRP